MTMPDYLLVVDDFEPNRRMVASILRVLGHDTAEAEDGRAAIAAMADGRPSLVLLDIAMPGLSGWDVLSWMRRDPRCFDVPVVTMTGYDDPATAANSWTLGCTFHLIKPFGYEMLSLVVNRVLGGIIEEPSDAPSSALGGVPGVERS